jgi:phosphatidylinositol-3,4,5-trisphosphate 3-phosphatase/dual-specificity protein phosphatase PTEN
MSFPADGVESTYRNSIHEVSAMLNCRHFGHFIVFNLSERVYDYGILNDMVCTIWLL